MQQGHYETIKLSVDGKEIDYALAKRLSEDIVSAIITESILIAWFDGKKGEEHPQVSESQHKPGWLAYADGHGRRIRFDVIETEYSLIFAGASADEHLPSTA